jgi:hypothetical protein
MQPSKIPATQGFWLFWHMPKCGGTSFGVALASFLNIIRDYQPDDRSSLAYQRYVATPVDLSSLSGSDCLLGHYNIAGVRLWERYPTIFDHRPRLVTVLRDPLEAAVSGVRYGIQRQWTETNPSHEELRRRVLARASYFASVFGVKNADDILALKKRIWGSCDIASAEQLLQCVYAEAVRLRSETPSPLPMPPFPTLDRHNKTAENIVIEVSEEVKSEFREKAHLDYAIYKALTTYQHFPS